VIKAEDIRDYTVKQNFAEKFAKQLGASVGSGLASSFSGLRLN
jgi:protease-4